MFSYSTLKIFKNFLRKASLTKDLKLALRCHSTASQAVQSVRNKYDLPLPQNDPSVVTKLLKIAIIGTPNSGKSTLINQIVERRVFAMSKKVHTTRSRSRAVHIEGNTQLIFLDTPGLVTAIESQKYKLGQKFMSDGENAIEEADVIGVVHDISNIHTRNKLDEKVLRLLYLYQEKESFLVLNKIDTIKSKRFLLNLSKTLTGGKLRDYKKPLSSYDVSEIIVNEVIKDKTCWECFSDIFMVSALLGMGTSDIKSYLLNAAQPGKWIFDENVFTDQKPVHIIEEAVRSKLLDHLPHEVPYNINVELEYLDFKEDDAMIAVVIINCDSQRIEKLVLGNGGQRIKMIAREAEQAVIDTFQIGVHLRLMVTNKQSKQQGHLSL